MLLDFGRDRFDLVPLDFAAAGMAVLLINSHVEHAHAEAGYGERRAECELVARELGVTFVSDLTLQHLDEAAGRVPAAALRRARHVVTENERVRQVALLLADGRIAEVGPVLTASHASMRDDFENSVPAIDLAVEAALGAGALGARLTGGGFGGSCLALVRIGDADAVAESVVARVTAAGHARPSVTAIAPSAGAGREAGA